jgi:regulatory protein
VSPQITDLEPQKKNPKRVNVFLDGAFAFGISLESKIVNRLKVGEELKTEQVEQLIFNDQVERLYDKAIKFLSFRPRSEREVRDNLLQKLRLTDKGEEEKKNFERSVEEVVQKLQKTGQIADREFAGWWIQQRTNFKKTSPRVIKAELFKKGINKEIIDNLFSEISIDPLQLALDAAKKKARNFQKYDKKTAREKLGRYLASKGFDWEIVKKTVDTIVQKE